MLTYQEVMNDGFLYLLVAIVLAVVCAVSALFFKKSRDAALKYGVSKEELNAICKNTMVLTIVPSIAIVVGVFSLSAVTGVPWAWLRLSVIGSVIYELMAAEMTTTAMGFSDVTQAFAAPASVFGAVMFIMTLGIIASPVVNAFVSKPLSEGSRKAGGSKPFSPLMNSCFMIAIFAVWIPVNCAKGVVAIMVMITAALFSQLIGWVANKTGAKWLHEFNLSVCLIVGMVSSIFWTGIFVGM